MTSLRRSKLTGLNLTTFEAAECLRVGISFSLTFVSRLHNFFRFVGSDNPETYFKDTERTRVVSLILHSPLKN